MKNISLAIICILTLTACSQSTQSGNVQLANGSIDRIENFKSKFVSPRTIDVWLPDGYTADQEYAVLYMHDGQMLFDSTKSWNKQEWGVDETLGQLMKEGIIRNSIVVGIWNTEYRHSEYFPQKPFERLPKKFQDSLLHHGQRSKEALLFKKEVCSDDYLKFIVKELKPFIDDKYVTLADARNTFIAGSSMGGLISMYAWCEYPEVFHGAACLSTHWVGTFDTLNNPIPQQFANYLEEHLMDKQDRKIYFDFGTETLDALYEPYQAMIDSIMVKKNYPREQWITLKFTGENHSEKSWSKRLATPLKFLLQ